MMKSMVLAVGLSVFPAHAIESAAAKLADLTVLGGLPSGCALVPASNVRPLPIGRTLPDVVVNSNPWVGSDRRIVATIYETLYGSPRLPDAPPMSHAATAAFLLQF